MKTTWDGVRVSDVVRVHKNEPIPADLVLLDCESAEGICFVETANLDGETNLKLKKGLEETIGWASEG